MESRDVTMKDRNTAAISSPAVQKAVAYARVSTKEQDKEGFSIPAQQKLLLGYGTAEGIRIVKEFVDVETAKQAGRTNFAAMVKYLKTHPDIRILLVEKTDRLYRNLRDWVTLDDLDIAIHLVKEGIVLSRDSRSSEKFVHGIKVLMAKNYVDNLSEEARKGMQEKAEQGVWPSYAPHGYRNVRRPDGRSIIEVDPVSGPIISKLFGWYAQGDLSVREVAARAHAAGLVNRTSGGRMAASMVHSVLRSRFYAGEFVWKKRLYRGTHQPLVSRELWARVQAMLDGRNETNVRGTKHNFAFTGMITCGHCGCAMVGELKKGRYVYYHCTGFKGKCGERYVREEMLEEKLSALLGRLQFSDDVLEWLKKALRESHADQKQEHEAAIARLRTEYDLLQQRLHTMYIDKLDGRVDAELFDKLSVTWREQQSAYQREIDFHQAADQSYLEDGITLLTLAKSAKALFDQRPPEDKRKLLKFALSNCSWKGGEVAATFRQPFNLIEKVAPPSGPEGGDGGGISTLRPEWWAREDSNLQPSGYEPLALTIELRARLPCGRRSTRSFRAETEIH
jgi:site-specific DNA recombinase